MVIIANFGTDSRSRTGPLVGTIEMVLRDLLKNMGAKLKYV